MTQLQRWQTSDQLPPDLKEILDNYTAEELEEAFAGQLEFGTAGMRGLLGAGPNRMNIFTVGKANLAYGRYLLNKYPKGAKVAIAYDNRHYSKEFAFSCANQLAKLGIVSYVFDSLRPTPELSFAISYLNCQGGIVITASHNPKEYNGYKVYDETGCQLTPEKIDEVIALVNEIKDELKLDFSINEKEKQLIKIINKEVDIPYQKAVLDIQLQPELLKNLKIVFSPQHGTAYPLLYDILTEAGFDVTLVESQISFDPDFSCTLSPNPEDPAAYIEAIKIAKEIEADIILTTDPDADRMGIVILHNGEYLPLTGNQGGTVLLEYILSTRKKLGLLPENGIIYNTIVTSDAGEKVAAIYGVKTEKTLTGFKFIGEKIKLAKESNGPIFLMGYEESYGYLLADFVRDKDALQSCLMLSEAANYYKSKNLTLLDVLNQSFNKVGAHHEVTESLSFPGSAGLEKISTIMSSLRESHINELAGNNLVYQEDYLKLERTSFQEVTPLNFPASDVLKFGFEDGSWIAVRPSGTEPKVKLYYCIVGEEKTLVEKYSYYQSALHKLINI